MDIKTWNDEELADELTGALEYMALQYLPDDGGVMTHDCMNAKALMGITAATPPMS